MFKRYKDLRNEVKSEFTTEKKQELQQMNRLYLKIIGIVVAFNVLVALLMFFLIDSLVVTIATIIIIVLLNIFEIKIICDLSESLVDLYRR